MAGHMRYHPRIGRTYTPGLKLRLPGPNGHLLRTNGAGFRSDREFAEARAPGKFRALAFGDSQTAGDGVANPLRFTDLLEAGTPGLELFNCAVSGTGTDQHFLAWRDLAALDRDLVVICVHVENIRRVTQPALPVRDEGGEIVYLPKPYFVIEGGELALRHVPAPKRPWTAETAPASVRRQAPAADAAPGPLLRLAKAALRRAVPSVEGRNAVKKALSARIARLRPLPDYDRPDSPAWLLLRRILETWIAQSPAPVLIAPLPMQAHIDGASDPSRYQARFAELAAATGCGVLDPLPAILRMDAARRRALWSERTGHLSAQGHAALAELLGPEIRRRMAASRQG